MASLYIDSVYEKSTEALGHFVRRMRLIDEEISIGGANYYHALIY
jgi:hypothetical protein